MKTNVLEYLINTVSTNPNKLAFLDQKNKVTFQELNDRARKLGEVLKENLQGKINQPIAIFMNKGVESVIAFMGILYSGNYYSPLDISSPKERIQVILNSLQPEIILTNLASHDQLNRYGFSIKNVIIETTFKECFELKEEGNYQKVLDTDPVYVLFTSGSTGVPKGVVISHRSVIDYTEWLKNQFQFDVDTIFGNQAPLHFDNSVLDIYSTLKNGALTVFIPEYLFMFPNKLFSFLNQYEVNTIFWVPSALAAVATSGVLHKMQLNNIKKILFCGEIMPTKIYNEWKREYPDILFANLYGPTEITDVCSFYIIDRMFEDDESIPIGNACDNTQLLILNEKNEIIEKGEKGELCVRGACLSLGYYRNQEKTDQVFIQNPLNNRYRDLIYKTGDLVKINEYNELIYLGRMDSQIKYQGHRIELGEIDTAAYSIQEIKQCCTLFDGEKITLSCSIRNNITEKEIYNHLKNRLPTYMLPKLIRIMDELPLNKNGKIDRVLIQNEIDQQLCISAHQGV